MRVAEIAAGRCVGFLETKGECMSRTWKILLIISLILNGVSLLYLYAYSHPNPYDRQYYETEQIKLELRQLRDELAALKAARAVPAP